MIITQIGPNGLPMPGTIDLSKYASMATISAYTYDGSAKQPTPTVTCKGKTLVAGTDFNYSYSNNTNAGTATCTVTAIGKKYKGSISQNFTINKLSLTIPSLSNTSKTYNGSAQSPTISGFNSTWETQGGTASATNANTYTVTWSLNSTANTQWSDGTTAIKSGSWTIGKATGSLTLSTSSITVGGTSGTTKSFTFTYTGDGSFTVTSSATSVCTVSRSGTTIYVTSVAAGSSTITVTMSAGTNYTGASKTCAATVIIVPTTKAFSACTIAEIGTYASSAANLVAAGIWTIGDVANIATYGSYSGIRLVHVLTSAQKTSPYYTTTGNIVIEFTNDVKTQMWANGDGSIVNYSSSDVMSALYTGKSGTIYSGLNSALSDVLKIFTVPAATADQTTTAHVGSVSYAESYLHIASCKEVGLSNGMITAENNYTFTFDYYKDSSTATARRTAHTLLSSSSMGYNLRSHAGGFAGVTTTLSQSYYINTSGGLTTSLTSQGGLGVIPIAVI